MSRSRCSRQGELRGGGGGGVTAKCTAVTTTVSINDGRAVTRQTDTTVIGSWLQRGRLQLAAETDKLSHTFTDTDTDHG